jgi:hypothetical protein
MLVSEQLYLFIAAEKINSTWILSCTKVYHSMPRLLILDQIWMEQYTNDEMVETALIYRLLLGTALAS